MASSFLPVSRGAPQDARYYLQADLFPVSLHPVMSNRNAFGTMGFQK
jgi:hypothetical protein